VIQIAGTGQILCESLTLCRASGIPDRDAEWPAQFSANTVAKPERQPAEDRGEGGHHDGPEAEQPRLADRVQRLVALRFQREVDHHDRVLLHNADEQNDSDQRDHAELAAADQQRENRPDTGGRSGPAPAACKI
jgi:hypothetical protein